MRDSILVALLTATPEPEKDTDPMFKAFNSFQIVGLFAAFPFLLSWLFSSADFQGVGAAKVVAVIAYLVFYIFMCFSTYSAIERDR